MDRDREDQPPREPAEPRPEPREQTHPAAADHVVAMVDRLEQGLEMVAGPRLEGRSHEDERRFGALQRGLERPVPAARVGLHRLDGRPAAPGEQVAQGVGGSPVAAELLVAREHDHQNRGVGQRVAVEVSVERVEFVMRRGHSASRRSIQTGSGASQRARAAR